MFSPSVNSKFFNTETTNIIRITSPDPRFPSNTSNVELKTRLNPKTYNFYNNRLSQWKKDLWDGLSFKADFSLEQNLGTYKKFTDFSTYKTEFYITLSGGNADLVRYIDRESWQITPNWRLDASKIYQISKGSLENWYSKLEQGEITPRFELEVEFTGELKNYSSFTEFKQEISDVLLLICNSTSVCY